MYTVCDYVICSIFTPHKGFNFYLVTNIIRRLGSLFSVVSDYELDNRAYGFRSPAEAMNFSSSLCFQTGCGAYQAL
jgi:hypothetical protein